MGIKITILGSGTSTGVPMLGCTCDVCQSKDPHNYRTRASIAVDVTMGANSKCFVIDTGPEFRIQMIREKIIPPLNYLFTHTHADHCHGFDDLRSVYFAARKPVKCYAREEFILELKQRFHYMFEDTGYQGIMPVIEFTDIPKTGNFEIDTIPIETFSCPHGNILTSIFKIGSFLYATDFKYFPDEITAAWTGRIDTMIASGIRYGSHHTHSTIEETLALFEKLAVKRGILTHLSHEVDYQKVSAKLPKNVTLAYDGMIFNV